jgi:hypothetical protein
VKVHHAIALGALREKVDRVMVAVAFVNAQLLQQITEISDCLLATVKSTVAVGERTIIDVCANFHLISNLSVGLNDQGHHQLSLVATQVIQR